MTTTGRKFRTVEANFVKLNEIGDSVEGFLIEKSEQQFTESAVGRYKIECDDGSQTSFLGSTDMDDKLGLIEIGQYIRVTLAGTVKSRNGRDIRQFTVEVSDT